MTTASIGFRLSPLLGLALLASCAVSATPAKGSCHVGAYTLADGHVLDINATSTPGQLRWHSVNGRTGTLKDGTDDVWRGLSGWTTREDPTTVRFASCDAGRIEVDGQPGQKIALETVDTRFLGDGEMLRGRLVLPPGSSAVPVVVLVHGSERYSGVDFYHEQHLFPAHGIGVFLYDKRGTGESGGKYTQDFDVLANDAVAALGEARRLAGARLSRIGLHGSSQGGWVAPLAATRTDVDFVQVAYGLAESPAAEDREQVMHELRTAGHGPEVLAQAREVTDATAAFMVDSGAGAAGLREVKRKYADAPWWTSIRGEFSGDVLKYPVWVVRLVLPLFDRGTPWNHDPMPVLKAVSAPQLWMLAAQDLEAPHAGTVRQLATLADSGHPVTAVVFPNTDHGIVEFETAADGTRTKTRYAEGYLQMTMDWIRDGRLADHPYGRALVSSRP